MMMKCALRLLPALAFLLPATMFGQTALPECGTSRSYDLTKTKYAFWNKDDKAFFINDLATNQSKKVTGLNLPPEFDQSELFFFGPENRLMIAKAKGPHFAVVDSKTAQVISQFSQVARTVKNNGLNPNTSVSPSGTIISSVFDDYFSTNGEMSFLNMTKPESPLVLDRSKALAVTASDDSRTVFVVEENRLLAFETQFKRILFETADNFDHDTRIRWVGSDLRIGCKLFDSKGNLLAPKVRCNNYDRLNYSDDFTAYADASTQDPLNHKKTVIIRRDGTNLTTRLDNYGWNGRKPLGAEFSSDGNRIVVHLSSDGFWWDMDSVHDAKTGAAIATLNCPRK